MNDENNDDGTAMLGRARERERVRGLEVELLQATCAVASGEPSKGGAPEALATLVDFYRRGGDLLERQGGRNHWAEDQLVELAKNNLGYFAGYCDKATAERVWELFDCEHPVFGTTYPTAREAFELGRRDARRGLAQGPFTPPQRPGSSVPDEETGDVWDRLSEGWEGFDPNEAGRPSSVTNADLLRMGRAQLASLETTVRLVLEACKAELDGQRMLVPDSLTDPRWVDAVTARVMAQVVELGRSHGG